MGSMRNALLLLFTLAQIAAGLRVTIRLVRTARGTRIQRSVTPSPGELVTVIVPVLDERQRLTPCLEGLMAQPAEVQEILVVDGGSQDGTQALVRAAAEGDARIRLLDAAPIPADWNGKAHGLQAGLLQADPRTTWILTIDADVRPQPDLVRSLLAHVRRSGVALQGVATRQVVAAAADALLHPALLTTLVYRHGIPGHNTTRLHDVQANGQCSLFRREPLREPRRDDRLPVAHVVHQHGRPIPGGVAIGHGATITSRRPAIDSGSNQIVFSTSSVCNPRAMGCLTPGSTTTS